MREPQECTEIYTIENGIDFNVFLPKTDLSLKIIYLLICFYLPERWRNRWTSWNYWFTPQMPVRAATGTQWSQDPRIQFRSPPWMLGTNHWGHHCCFPDTQLGGKCRKQHHTCCAKCLPKCIFSFHLSMNFLAYLHLINWLEKQITDF